MKGMTLTQFVQGLAGLGTGFVLYPVLATPRAIRHLPRALKAAYLATHRENRIGPNLKTVIYILIPVGASAAPVIVCIGSSLGGAGCGSFTGMKDGLPGVLRRAFKDIKHVDEWLVSTLFPKLEDYKPAKLRAGEKPFDISPLKGFVSLGSASSAVVIGVPLMTGVALVNLPGLYGRAITEMTKHLDDFLLSVFMFVLVTSAVAPAMALVPTVAFSYNLATGCYRGYKEGFSQAVKKVFRDVRRWNKVLFDAVSGS